MEKVKYTYDYDRGQTQTRNFKSELVEFWDESKGYIKVAVKCLAIGMAIGFVKGIDVNSKSLAKLSDAIPKAPKAAIDISFDDLPDVLSLFTKEEVIRMCNDLAQKGLMMTEKDI